MRVVNAILSSFCAIIIIICSIAQFHHHDENGKMVVFSCTEHVYGNHNHNHTPIDGYCIDHSHCSHGCNDGNHQDEKNCSLKINIAKAEKKNIPHIIISCIIIDDIASDIEQNKKDYPIVTDEHFLSGDYSAFNSLRAPPSV